MTISIAWTRKESDVEQLAFASDSRISAGEKFDACPKMLALPRGDCGIAYAGTSGDALSMMLQLSLAIQSYPAAMKRSLELSALRTHALKIFNAMLKEIKLGQIRGNPSTIPTDASFLFGGYSWKRKDFEFWSLRYSKARGEFIPRPPMRLSVDTETNTISTETTLRKRHRLLGRIAFIGDQARAAERLVIRRLNEKLQDDPSLSRLHMEPFEAIRDLLRNRDWRHLPDKDSIGGPPQMMKVFQYVRPHRLPSCGRITTGSSDPSSVGGPVWSTRTWISCVLIRTPLRLCIWGDVGSPLSQTTLWGRQMTLYRSVAPKRQRTLPLRRLRMKKRQVSHDCRRLSSVHGRGLMLRPLPHRQLCPRQVPKLGRVIL
jgi:hypothetical protein